MSNRTLQRALHTSLAVVAMVVGSSAGAQTAPAQPGDRIQLRILRENAVNLVLDIDPAGNTVLPMAGDVHLAGVPAVAMQDSVRSALKRFVDPSMVAAVVLRRVVVGGDVLRPGIYYVNWAYTIREAIAEAGGVSITARENTVLLERGTTHRKLKDWQEGPGGAMPIESGDRLYVERRSWFLLNAAQLLTAIGVVASVIVTATR